MLVATKGFNYGPDETRVDEGAELADDFADTATVEYLISREAVAHVIEPTPDDEELNDPDPSPNTPKGKKSAREARTAPKESD